MYVPDHFSASGTAAAQQLILAHPFGALITHGAAGLDANHLPFELDTRAGSLGVLRAHVARANPLWREVSHGAEVLVIFRADDAYVSPNWYPSTHELHTQVPTWNYRVVHAHGNITVRDDAEFVRGLVGRLTQTHEAAQPVPWKMSDAPKNYIDTMLRAIVGIEIEITRLVGKLKLSQNRELRDRLSLADTFTRRGDISLGKAIRESIKEP